MCFRVPLMVWHPFKLPLSTFQSCSHYFQQHPERRDRMNAQTRQFSSPYVYSSSQMKISEKRSKRWSNMTRALCCLPLCLKCIFPDIASFWDENLRSKWVPSCIHLSARKCSCLLWVKLFPLCLSYSVGKKLLQCFIFFWGNTLCNKRW